MRRLAHVGMREDIGSWLEGPPRAADAGPYQGANLGLPQEGPGAMAPMGRRLVALVIDGMIGQVIAMGLLGYQQGMGGIGTFKPLLVVFVLNLILVGTAGFTIGHRLLGLRVQRCPAGYVGMRRSFIRAVLLCLGLPPLIIDRDGRGLHDRLAGTVIVRSR